MKFSIPVLREVNATHIRCDMAVRYEEENIPNDFPGRVGDKLTLLLEIDTKKVVGWPAGQTADFSMKVCDQGSYTLLAGDEVLASLDESYVPGCLPNRYGDYFEGLINKDGVIRWTPKAADILRSFFPGE